MIQEDSKTRQCNKLGVDFDEGGKQKYPKKKLAESDCNIIGLAQC